MVEAHAPTTNPGILVRVFNGVLGALLISASILVPADIGGLFDPRPGNSVVFVMGALFIALAVLPSTRQAIRVLNLIVCVMTATLLAGLWTGFPAAHPSVSDEDRTIASLALILMFILSASSLIVDRLPHHGSRA